MHLKLESGGFYVYGASHYGQALIRHLTEIGLVPLAALDRSPKCDSYHGVPVKIFGEGNYRTDLPVLVTILGFDGVTESLESAGFTNVVETLDVFAAFPKSLVYLNECGVLWMQSPISSHVNIERCNLLSSYWADEQSRQLFEQIIRYRTEPNAADYVIPETYEMYFPPDIPKLYEYEQLRILDVGIFDGDTFAGFYNRFANRISDYTGVEICLNNITALQARLQQMGLTREFIDVKRVAVGLPKGSSLIVRDNQSASSVEIVERSQLEQANSVEAANLGELMHKAQCNILKMDIEGADYDALVQAEEYIREKLPTLALSLYHRVEDLWEIPLLIEHFAPGKYDFYLRQEGHWLLETQFYAVPKIP